MLLADDAVLEVVQAVVPVRTLLQRLASPHLTYRHTLKKTAAQQKEACTASTAARRTICAGTAWLAAAAIDLDRMPEEMGSMPKSAGRSGAAHPMTVNETVIALIRPKPDLDQLTEQPAEAQAAARAAVDASDGIGTLTSYATEVAFPVKGTWKNPAIGSARADVVLTAPEAGLPLLFIEADNCTEGAALIAAKFDKYARFFKQKEKDADGIDKPMWRTRWSAPGCDEYERVHPPALLVFHQVGKRSAKSQIAKVADLNRPHRQGRWQSQAPEHGRIASRGCLPSHAAPRCVVPHRSAARRAGRRSRPRLAVFLSVVRTLKGR
ncbi:replication-relaxation family protein [Streptomyces sp. DB-54]